MLRLVEAAAMKHPVHMFNSQCNQNFKSLFGEVSRSTFRRCVDAGCVGHDNLSETILRWELKHNIRAERNDRDEPLITTIAMMPLPHAVLCATKCWSSWAFPISQNPRTCRGMRLSL
eukprot:2247210-Pyramimonas_sp.AAC.1